MSDNTLLIELGTEELPPKALRKLSDAFNQELLNGLVEAELINRKSADNAKPFASPRRLALSIENVISAQPDQMIERFGPAVAAAFKDDKPTPAAIGFAKSCGVEVDDLVHADTDKGVRLSYNVKQTGKTTAELIPAIIEQAIKRLPIAKRMRWGAGSAEFVRPVHWLVVMHGSDVIPLTILDVGSSNTSRGHRFHSDGEFTIDHADNYETTLNDKGHVIASFDKRQAMITEQVHSLASSINGVIEEDQALLDEVTSLVEHPTAVLGSFDKDFLSVPQECLVSSMRDHQKYFHVIDGKGALLPNFITVSNIQSKHPERVQEGNERVLRARLSDARFFWETDQKVKLHERVEKLDSVLFHVKLGSVLDKTKRIQKLAAEFATKMNGDAGVAERGALLAKADLVSDMVGEFDELQGIMGHYYANRDGEPGPVGECVEQHYWPKFAGDQLPTSIEAQSVALADKLDSLVGIYGAGEVPTGDKDPYALRRAALSVLRILIEKEHSLTLADLVSSTANVYAELQDITIDTDTQSQIVNFIRERLKPHFQNQEIPTLVIKSVMACEPASPLDFEHRVKAVNEFSSLNEAIDLAAANKRIGNILKKQEQAVSDVVDESALSETDEKNLYQAINNIEKDCVSLFDAGDYAQGLQKLASLRSPVDSFFENVMVMSDDAKQKANRLALLKRMQQLFLRVADISLLQA